MNDYVTGTCFYYALHFIVITVFLTVILNEITKKWSSGFSFYTIIERTH